MTALPWIYDDGGRAEFGFRGEAGDCVVRALAIGLRLPYGEAYDTVNERARRLEARMRGKRRSSARNGVLNPTIRAIYAELGLVWTPTVTIGSGCKVHLAVDELPDEQVVFAAVSKHMTVVVDGVIHDTYDPSRDGTRCVYGYYTVR